ncbi:DUF488 domain-containing protein [Priestia megaterium]|uniref:DUF488 domain-containing protein n=1 Tax=Priestia megaterium TaxID=1404 RepID=UPI0025B0F959|nr:DUF488 domain-containing protein [Priestia megaterium]MDN3229515.1 DUF488 domain-containing protein [Priestia megaterium]
MINIATIGFSKKTLEQFLNLLKSSKTTCLIDTRLNNTSQLAGFAKKNDLKFILEELVGIEYKHSLELAPTQDILTEFKSKVIDWHEYEKRYTALLKQRNIEKKINEIIEGHQNICFLCSEHQHHNCHRSLLADYIKETNPNVNIVHLC